MKKLLGGHANESAKLLMVCVISAILGIALGGKKLGTAEAYRESSSRQSDEKAIVIAGHKNDPLRFGNLLRLNSIDIGMGRSFSWRSIADKTGGQTGDWLEGLEFRLENKGDKPITYIHFELQFPDTKVNGPLLVYREISAGIKTNSLADTSTQSKPILIRPGEMFTFTLERKHLERIKKFLELRNFQLAEINKVVVQVLDLTFEDGFRWTLGGSYFRPNHDAPGGYERINLINQ